MVGTADIFELQLGSISMPWIAVVRGTKERPSQGLAL